MATDKLKLVYQSEERLESTPKELLPTGFNETGYVEEDELARFIAERAYLKAELRGFEPGHEMEDWLEAEAEIRNSRTNIYGT